MTSLETMEALLRVFWCFLLLWAAVACVNPDAAMDPSDSADIVFEVPKGSSANGIGPKLAEQGLIPSPWKWKWFLRGENASCVKAGKFRLRRSMSMREVLKTICGAPLADEVAFKVLEGWRIRDIDAALAAEGFISPGQYQTIAESKTVTLPFTIESSTLEGFLYPETYMINADKSQFNAKAFIERQIKTFDERFYQAHKDKLGKRSLHEIVVMASMIEREEPTESQRPIVAGILWKRLDNQWKLGVDATSRYTLDDWSDRRSFLKMLRDPNDPYNTRLHYGLPPTAIGNPSLSALKSVTAPESSEFWFYLHDKNGVFHGGKDGAHHERNRAKYNVY